MYVCDVAREEFHPNKRRVDWIFVQNCKSYLISAGMLTTLVVKEQVVCGGKRFEYVLNEIVHHVLEEQKFGRNIISSPETFVLLTNNVVR